MTATRTLLHTETGFSLDLNKYPDADVSEIASIIKDEIDVRIGRISLNNLIQGNVECANGFEVIVGEVESETSTEVETVTEVETSTETAVDADNGVEETVEEETTEGAVVVGDLTVTTDVVETNDPSVAVEDAPAPEPTTVEEPEVGSFAADILAGKMGSGNKQKEFNETNKRRHTKKEVAMEEARKHAEYGSLIEGLEELGVVFNYSQPDLRWFELVITSAVTEDNVNSRKNPYIDVAPRKNGSIGVSLYLGGKSATKRTVFMKSEDGSQSAASATIEGVKALLAEGGEYDLLIKG